MIGIFETALQLQSFCDQRGWRSCFIGGIAVQRWSEPRLTRGVDLTLLAGFGGEDVFIDPLIAAYRPRIENAKDFARRYRVLLLGTPEGVGIDISLGALPFEESVVRRASVYSFGPGLPELSQFLRCFRACGGCRAPVRPAFRSNRGVAVC